MGQITPAYAQFTQLRQSGSLWHAPARPLKEHERDALNKVKSGTHSILGTGLVGADAQEINRTLLQLEKLDQLSQGKISAINLKAALDLGQQLSQGPVHEVLQDVGTPLTAAISLQALGSSLDRTLKDPTPDNMKGLMTTTRGATATVGQLSQALASVAANHGFEAGSLLARGSQVIGQVTPALNIGIATLDLVLAGRDIQAYWQRPSEKNAARMGLGVVAAGASVLRAGMPALGTTATIVATLADVGKLSLDLDWNAVLSGGQAALGNLTASGQKKLQTELGLQAHLPTTHPVSLADLARP